MKALVTGHEGFIGSHLMDRLDHCTGMDKKSGMSTANYPVLKEVVGEYHPDVIVHLGANCSSQISLRDPRLDFVDNVLGTFNVCEVARENGGIPVIFNSTMKVYPGEDGFITPYGASKQVGERYLHYWLDLYGVPFVINRPSSVYGPRQNGTEDGGWVTHFIQSAIKGKPITLFGDGTQSRDVLYVDDHVDLLVDQIEHFEKYQNQEFDSGGGVENELSLNELLNFLSYHNVTQAPKLPGDVQRFVCDNQKVTAANGWKPKVSWAEGVQRTKQWFAQRS